MAGRGQLAEAKDLMLPDKEAVFAALDEVLMRQIDDAKRRAKASADAATHEESRQEDKHDMRSTEESYLARGQAQRVADLEMDRATLRSLVRLDFRDGRPIASSALVALEDADEDLMVVLLAPAGGGQSARVQGVDVRVVTPTAPLARALVGKEEGDEVLVIAGRSTREYEIVGVL